MLVSLIKRNIKVYFKDKGVFFPSLITPLILLVLFATFLKNVYVDSIKMQIPEGFSLSTRALEGFAGGWLVSSLLATSCITVSFCANMIMVQDKVFGNIKDIAITGVKSSVLSLSYYVATVVVSAIICFTAFAVGLVYLAFVGFYMTVADVLLVCVDIILLVLFGTALSSIVGKFLSSQGGISAISSLVSSTYGFVCGAYMPIAQFGEAMQKTLMFLPGTYGTGLLRKHFLNGVLDEITSQGLPTQLVAEMEKSFDVSLFFFGTNVSQGAMFAVLGGTVALLLLIYLFISKKKPLV